MIDPFDVRRPSPKLSVAYIVFYRARSGVVVAVSSDLENGRRLWHMGVMTARPHPAGALNTGEYYLLC